MRLLSITIAALPFALPLGGTVLELPVDGRADPAGIAACQQRLELETWDCEEHPAEHPGKVHLPFCNACGRAMAEVEDEAGAKDERYLRLEVTGGRLRVVSGPWTGLALLRQSAIESAIEGSGLSLRTTGWRMRGHVLLEVDPARVEDQGKAKGSSEEQSKDQPKALAVALAAFGKVETSPGSKLVLVRLAEQKDGHDRAALVAAAERAGYRVADLLWIVNQCAGELVTAAG